MYITSMYNVLFPFYAVWLYTTCSYYDMTQNKESYAKQLDLNKVETIFYNVYGWLPNCTTCGSTSTTGSTSSWTNGSKRAPSLRSGPSVYNILANIIEYLQYLSSEILNDASIYLPGS